MTKFSILIVVTKFYDFKPTLGLVIWLMGLCTDEILGFFFNRNNSYRSMVINGIEPTKTF